MASNPSMYLISKNKYSHDKYFLTNVIINTPLLLFLYTKVCLLLLLLRHHSHELCCFFLCVLLWQDIALPSFLSFHMLMTHCLQTLKLCYPIRPFWCLFSIQSVCEHVAGRHTHTQTDNTEHFSPWGSAPCFWRHFLWNQSWRKTNTRFSSEQ